MRALTYSRVSTSDKGQNPQIQVAALRSFCEAKEWPLIEEIIDSGYGGGTSQNERPGLKRVMEFVYAGKVDVIIVTKLDRLFRSLKHLMAVLDEFQRHGVLFVSINDNLDLTNASGRLMCQILGAFSEFERALISERTIVALAYVKSKREALRQATNTA